MDKYQIFEKLKAKAVKMAKETRTGSIRIERQWMAASIMFAVLGVVDKDGSTLKTYNFRGAFPTAISPIDLSYASENEIERFTVEFQVQYWEAATTS